MNSSELSLIFTQVASFRHVLTYRTKTLTIKHLEQIRNHIPLFVVDCKTVWSIASIVSISSSDPSSSILIKDEKLDRIKNTNIQFSIRKYKIINLKRR